MLSIRDCIDMCGLTEEEVLAIAAHERIPQAAAAEMAHYLIRTPEGELYVKAMIRDDIAAACACGNTSHAIARKLVLRNYILRHPDCEERHRRELHLPERRLA